MPITKERKLLYPDNWDKISQLVREKADNKCELCYAPNHLPHPKTKSKVVLTVHHINNNPTDNRKINLIALCQKCHNRLDLPFRRKKKEPEEMQGIKGLHERRELELKKAGPKPKVEIKSPFDKLWKGHKLLNQKEK